jgi:restriction system protein
MARHGNRSRRHRTKTIEPFLEKGIQVLVMTGALWLATLFMAGSPALATVATGLRSILWLPLTIGLGLLGVHLVVRKLTPPSPEAPAARRPFPDLRGAMGNGAAPAAPKPSASSPRDTHFGSGLKDKPSSPNSKTDARTAPFKETRWSSSVFAAIEWRRFEAVVETLFAQAGFETRSQSHGADGGVDIWLHSRNADGPVSVVQCKHWQGKPVTVKELREFLGVMTSHGIKRGTYATTSRYTADALAFAKANGINAQDGNGLLDLIAQRTPEQQARLLAVAYEGEYWKPTCASCGVKMVQRESKKDGAPFWGCMNYPRCKRTLAMKAA